MRAEGPEDSPTQRDDGVLAAEAVDVVKTYGSGDFAVRALDGVSESFAAQHFTAIMGPSGSGKSTLLHCLAGLDDVDGGTVYIGGQDLTAMSDSERTVLRRDKVGFVFQAYNLVPTLDARENILLPLRLGRRDVDEAWLAEVTGALGLDDRLDHRPTELSGGEQQRVATARALIGRPDVVFADEPTGALDSTSSSELLAFLRRAVHDLGQSIVMVTHDPLAASSADRIVFLADGRVVDELVEPTPDKVLDAMRRLRVAANA